MEKNKIVIILVVLFLVSLFVPVRGFAYDYSQGKNDKYSNHYEYDDPDEWSYREDWDDDLDDYWGTPESVDEDDVDTIFGVALAGFIIMFVIIIGIISLAVKIVEIIGLWKIFTKAGEPGYAAIIPFYNEYVKTKIGGTAWWWMLVEYGTVILGALGSAFTAALSSIISLASIVGKLCIKYNLCKKFNKDIVYTLLMTFLPFIGTPMLGFSKDAEYDESVVTNENSLFESIFNSANGSSSPKYCSNCGEKNSGSEKFCKNCGNKLD